MYFENFNTLMKEIKDNANKQICYVLGLEELVL